MSRTGSDYRPCREAVTRSRWPQRRDAGVPGRARLGSARSAREPRSPSTTSISGVTSASGPRTACRSCGTPPGAPALREALSLVPAVSWVGRRPRSSSACEAITSLAVVTTRADSCSPGRAPASTEAAPACVSKDYTRSSASSSAADSRLAQRTRQPQSMAPCPRAIDSMPTHDLSVLAPKSTVEQTLRASAIADKHERHADPRRDCSGREGAEI